MVTWNAVKWLREQRWKNLDDLFQPTTMVFDDSRGLVTLFSYFHIVTRIRVWQQHDVAPTVVLCGSPSKPLFHLKAAEPGAALGRRQYEFVADMPRFPLPLLLCLPEQHLAVKTTMGATVEITGSRLYTDSFLDLQEKGKRGVKRNYNKAQLIFSLKQGVRCVKQPVRPQKRGRSSSDSDE